MQVKSDSNSLTLLVLVSIITSRDIFIVLSATLAVNFISSNAFDYIHHRLLFRTADSWTIGENFLVKLFVHFSDSELP